MVPLETSRLFRQLSQQEIATLRTAAREQSFSAGQEIFKEGDEGDGVYVVKEGLVEITARMGQNARQVFSKVVPGDFFGEMAVIEEKTRWATPSAKEAAGGEFTTREGKVTH